MRLLHRNVGFFILGLVIVYTTSGIVLVFRDTDFMKIDRVVKTALPVGTKPDEVGQKLRLRDFKINGIEGDVVYFEGGSFDSATGETEYTSKELMFPFNKITALHKIPSKNPFHWINLAFGILLLFMAISSFWMFKAKSVVFRKGMYTVLAGIVIALILILAVK